MRKTYLELRIPIVALFVLFALDLSLAKEPDFGPIPATELMEICSQYGWESEHHSETCEKTLLDLQQYDLAIRNIHSYTTSRAEIIQGWAERRRLAHESTGAALLQAGSVMGKNAQKLYEALANEILYLSDFPGVRKFVSEGLHITGPNSPLISHFQKMKLFAKEWKQRFDNAITDPDFLLPYTRREFFKASFPYLETLHQIIGKNETPPVCTNCFGSPTIWSLEKITKGDWLINRVLESYLTPEIRYFPGAVGIFVDKSCAKENLYTVASLSSERIQVLDPSNHHFLKILLNGPKNLADSQTLKVLCSRHGNESASYNPKDHSATIKYSGWGRKATPALTSEEFLKFLRQKFEELD